MITKTPKGETNKQYDEQVTKCRDLFVKKAYDYGTSWRALRTQSVIDQMWIKLKRVRTLQETKENRVGDTITSEFIGVLNYAVMGLIQLDATDDTAMELPVKEVSAQYDQKIQETKELMFAKNHDYGEAWREFSQESLVDLMLVKLLRMNQIIQNDGKTTVSEGIDASYRDIVNYCIFALIHIEEKTHAG